MAISADLRVRFQTRKDQYLRQAGQRDQLLQQKQEVEGELTGIAGRTERNQRLLVIFQKTSETARDKKRLQIQDLVSRALQAIFGPEYGFEIEMDVRGARPEAELYVLSRSGEQVMRNKPADSRGGGVQDIIAFTLKVAYQQLHADPKVANVHLFDEPMKMVSVDHGTAVAEYINWLCSTFGLQILMVTHNEDYASSAARSFQVQIRDGVSELLEVEGGTLLL